MLGLLVETFTRTCPPGMVDDTLNPRVKFAALPHTLEDAARTAVAIGRGFTVTMVGVLAAVGAHLAVSVAVT